VHDELVRIQALDITQSFIVQAPAGAGKTELLTQRFLKLLTCVKMPEEILAITFTRKAAAQMRQRIINALLYAQNNPLPEKKHAKNTWHLAQVVLNRDRQLQWELTRNPNRLRVVTIDSLCATIVNRLPLLSKVGGDFEVVDFAQPYYQEAVHNLLTQTSTQEAWGAALGKLLYHLDNRMEQIAYLLILLLGKRDQWLPYLLSLSYHSEDLLHYLNTVLQRIIEEQLFSSRNLLREACQGPLVEILRYVGSYFAANDPAHPLALCAHCDSLPDNSIGSLEQWRAIVDFLTKTDNTWRKSFTLKQGLLPPSNAENKIEKQARQSKKALLADIMQSLSENTTCLSQLCAIKELPEATLTGQQLEILSALGALLPVLVAHLQLVFQSKGKVDFIEIALRASHALGEELAPSEIALRLDQQYRHILIDEYQDTSVTQYRLFEKLVNGWEAHDARTLFLVGDPMQSIYRFRGAEVSLFMHTAKYGLGNIALTPLLLTVNFRSDLGVIDWVNQCFSQLFPQSNSPTLGGVVYAHSHAYHGAQERLPVVVTPVLSREEQTLKIIDIINTDLQKENHSIAILVRARKHLSPLIQTLKKLHIDFIAHEAQELSLRAHVMDLLSLLKALKNPQDIIAWYSVLRAPWLGLTLSDLWQIAQSNTQNNILISILSFEACIGLGVDAKARLRKFVPLLQWWLHNQGRQRLSAWLRGFWLVIGGD